jgi:hypothetical protein
VAEAASRDHRHRDAARGDRRRERQADLVADAPGRVFVDLRARHAGEVEDVAGVEHGVGPGRELGVVEPAKEDRHQHGRGLVVRDDARGDARDEAAQRLGVERFAVALATDELLDRQRHRHCCTAASLRRGAPARSAAHRRSTARLHLALARGAWIRAFARPLT